MLCRACHSNSNEVFYVKDGYPIVRCRDCALGWVDPASVTPGEIERIYEADYFSGGRRDGYADYVASEPVLRREFCRTLADIRKFKPGGHLVELGCAYGFFLDEASCHFTCAGLELSGPAVEACQQRGLAVSQGPADAFHISALGPADVVVMLDVIEHLPDPDSTLASVLSILKPGGILVITTGDWSSPLAKVMGRRWRLMTPPQHLFYFSPGNLARLCTRLGFAQPEWIHPWKFVPMSLIWFQLRRYLPLPKFQFQGPLANLGLYINLFDSVRFIAKKPV